jgi:hypothetical protein
MGQSDPSSNRSFWLRVINRVRARARARSGPGLRPGSGLRHVRGQGHVSFVTGKHGSGRTGGSTGQLELRGPAQRYRARYFSRIQYRYRPSIVRVRADGGRGPGLRVIARSGQAQGCIRSGLQAQGQGQAEARSGNSRIYVTYHTVRPVSRQAASGPARY